MRAEMRQQIDDAVRHCIALYGNAYVWVDTNGVAHVSPIDTRRDDAVEVVQA